MPAQETARPLLEPLDSRVGSHVDEAGHPRLGTLEVTGVDPVHGRLNGGQIGLQCLKFGVIYLEREDLGCGELRRWPGRMRSGGDVRIGHASESIVSRCPPR